jgi:hypothetical protein
MEQDRSSPGNPNDVGDQASQDFDFSTPEAQIALEGVSKLVLEIRDELRQQVDLSERKIRIYERSLGVAVVPALIRRLSRRVISRINGG